MHLGSNWCPKTHRKLPLQCPVQLACDCADAGGALPRRRMMRSTFIGRSTGLAMLRCTTGPVSGLGHLTPPCLPLVRFGGAGLGLGLRDGAATVSRYRRAQRRRLSLIDPLAAADQHVWQRVVRQFDVTAAGPYQPRSRADEGSLPSPALHCGAGR